MQFCDAKIAGIQKSAARCDSNKFKGYVADNSTLNGVVKKEGTQTPISHVYNRTKTQLLAKTRAPKLISNHNDLKSLKSVENLQIQILPSRNIQRRRAPNINWG